MHYCLVRYNIYFQIKEGMEDRQEDRIMKTRPLKEIYPDLELRKKFADMKLENNKGFHQILVRCEPHPKHCRITDAPYLNILAPTSCELAYISATVHTRVVGKKVTGPESSTYLFNNNKLVTAFR